MKFTVDFIKTIDLLIRVDADSEEEAKEKATKLFDEISTAEQKKSDSRFEYQHSNWEISYVKKEEELR